MSPEEIRARIDTLRAADRACALFGASEHRYALAPPASRDDVAEIERTHGITLPDDYRTFVTTVANGGAGPEYGLFPLEEALRGESPGEPFRYSLADARALIERRRSGVEEYAMLGDEDDASGLLALCDAGCGWTHYLVVAGDARGTVWTGGELGYCPLFDEAGTLHTFASWYAAWLDEASRELASGA